MNPHGRVLAVGPGTLLSVGSPLYWRVARAVGVILLAGAVVGLGLALRHIHALIMTREAPAAVQPPSMVRALSDLRPVRVTITSSSWTKVPETVTVDALRTDHRLWRQMHFDDWDRIPAPVRNLGLSAMVRAYTPVFQGPRVWRAMSAADWDRVPQPIRAMAYLRMIWHWAIAEQVGAEFDLAPDVLAQSIAAIVMAESWFEHRAFNENAWGNRDLGLAQCSDYCRTTLDEMSARGDILFTLAEADYLNPWIAARVATIWFERELHRAAGDVDLAIRAYHRGMDAALDDKGTAYHTRVVRLREGYVRTQRSSASWQFLVGAVALR